MRWTSACVAPLLVLGAFLLLSLAASSRGQALPRGIAVNLEEPKEGKTYEGQRFVCRGTIPDTPEDQMIKVRIIGFGMTHHIVFLPATERSPRNRELRFEDKYLPISEGDHEVSILVFFGADTDPVWRQRVKFRVVKESQEKFRDGVTAARGMMGSNSHWTIHDIDMMAWRFLAGRTPEMREAFERNADKIYSQCMSERHGNDFAYSALATAYMGQFDRDRAIGALLLAHQAWEAGKQEIQHPRLGAVGYGLSRDPTAPYHFSVLARLYLQYGHLDEAIAWYEAKVKRATDVMAAHPGLSTHDLLRAHLELRWAYADIAFAHMLLRNDIQAYQEWMKKSEDLFPQIEALRKADAQARDPAPAGPPLLQ